MKKLIKKILKEENDFDWAKDTNPLSKSEVASKLSVLQGYGYYINERWLDTNTLVDFIYRLALPEDRVDGLVKVIDELSDSIYDEGKEIGQQIGWEEGHNEGYREGQYDGKRDARYDIEDELEDARDDGYAEGYEAGTQTEKEEMEQYYQEQMKKEAKLIYKQAFEDGRAYESEMDTEDYERRQSGFDPRDYDEDYDN